MKKLFLALAAAPIFVLAQVTDVLLEACNALPDLAKRIQCLKSAVGASGAQTGNSIQTHSDTLRRSFGNMRASLDAGMSYNTYQAAILDLAQAVQASKLDARESGSGGYEGFDQALDAYKNAGTLWLTSMKFHARRDNSLAYAGGLPVGMNRLDWMVGKYGLSTGSADLLRFHRGINVAQARSSIWRNALGREEKGLAHYPRLGSKEPDPTYANETLESARGAALKVVEKTAAKTRGT